jgi:cytochrome c-type biogenesis protein CcmI
MSLYLFFVLMLGVSLAWVLWFLYRPIKQNSIDLNAENIAIAQQKLKELEKDLTDGLLSELDFESSKQDLSQVLALELDNTDTSINTQTNKRFSLIFLVFFLPATSIFLYQNLSQTINHSDTMQGQQAPKKVFSLQEGIEKIHQHLEKNLRCRHEPQCHDSQPREASRQRMRHARKRRAGEHAKRAERQLPHRRLKPPQHKTAQQQQQQNQRRAPLDHSIPRPPNQ